MVPTQGQFSRKDGIVKAKLIILQGSRASNLRNHFQASCQLIALVSYNMHPHADHYQQGAPFTVRSRTFGQLFSWNDIQWSAQTVQEEYRVFQKKEHG